ncbi:MAG: TlyA family RNA methyltransferase [Clostridiaceae bacterium]
MSSTKERLDVVIVNNGMIDSREKAKAIIMEGKVFVDGKRIDKCGTKIKIDSNIELKGQLMPYVSRGGFKLEKAIKSFNIPLENKVCYDIGASTGGFTDCMLQNGAKYVYSIDVGYGQFSWKLRVDERVKCIERTNVRYLELDDSFMIGDFASIDVSFISLKKIIPNLLKFLKEDGEIVALIKPQFEAGREKVGKKGVVKDLKVHYQVVEDIIRHIETLGLEVLNLDYSPIKGPEGNIEYLVYFKKSCSNKIYQDELIEGVINNSHLTLKKEEK